jgi:hypothetical protein
MCAKRQTGRLTYLARPGEDPNRDTVVAPRLGQLVVADNASEVSFAGITFSDSNWNLPTEGHSEGQAESGMSAAIQAVGTHNFHLTHCKIQNVGAWGVELGAGCQFCGLADCLVEDFGAGGIRIGSTSGWNPTLSQDKLTRRNSVHDTIIAEGGRLHPGGVGILILNAQETQVENNEIVDLYYTGISAGWSWGYGPSGAHDNIIAMNHIHRIGQGVLSDMGGIYTLGFSPGTILADNRIHDIVSFDYGGWGIYFDEGTTGIHAFNNVVWDVKSEPFHQHYGTNNVVENNILALGREAQLLRTRGDNGPQATPEQRAALSFTLRNNIVYTRRAPLFAADWNGTNFALRDNLYWSADSRHPPSFPGGKTLAQWQAGANDQGSIVADPLFVDPEHGDFTLRQGSPTAKIGFRGVLSPAAVGPSNGGSYRGGAERAFPPPPPPQPIVDTFEETPVGDKPGGPLVAVNEEADHPAATVRVTDETAASGTHSLKIIDAAGQRFSYNPHLFYHPSLTEGTVVGSFALRPGPGTVFIHEWRDSASPYNVGPSLSLGADQMLMANGKATVRLPQAKWSRITITCSIGDAASGTYELRVLLPGESAAHVFPNLPCGIPSFHVLTWWGFVSNATDSAVFDLDDISLTTK